MLQGLFFAFFVASLCGAHTVQRTEPPVYQFPATEVTSQIQQAQALIEVFRETVKNDFGSQTWQVDFDWNQTYLGAGSTQYDGVFHIMLWGGWVRATYMTPGALAATLCHEAGHRLAGAPVQHFQGQDPWSSAEGQADHYAASVCLPRLYEALLKVHSPLLQRSQEPEAEVICRNSKDPHKCQWVATSGIDLIQVAQVYYEREVPFARPEIRAAEKPAATLEIAYPTYQCRMNTFTTDAVCDQGLACPRLACWFVQ